MILYVNGDLHSGAARAVNNFTVAQDDGSLWYLGRAPHPDNLEASYGARLAAMLKAKLILDTERGGSVSDIIAASKNFIGSNKFKEQLLVVIGWPEITPAVAEYHEELNILKAPHIFFSINKNNQEAFLIPDSYTEWLTSQGFVPISGFFDKHAHQAWANHLIPHLTQFL